MSDCSPQNLPGCVQKVRPIPAYVCGGNITVENRYTYHESCMVATTAGTGYAEGDLILVTRVYDNEVNPPQFVEALYLNANTQETIDPADIEGGTFEQCPTDTVVTWTICLQDDNGEFTRLFAKDLETDAVLFQNHDRVTGADYTPVGAVTVCDGDGVDTEHERLCDDDGQFIRHFVHEQTTGDIRLTYDTDLGGDPYISVGVVRSCDETVLTETGCLSSPASVDLGNVQRCHLREVHIGSDIFTVNISPGWSVQELVDAVNAEQPDLLSVEGSSVLIQNGVSLQNLTLVCRDDIFLEDFGVGGTDGNRVSTTATNYTFQNSGAILDSFYAITSFQDTGLTDWHTGEGSITADSQGDANGNAFFVGADAIPGELYRRSENVTKNREYSVSLFVIDTTIAAATLFPNLDVIIEDDQGNELIVHNTGDIQPRDRHWREINFDFVAITPNIEFVIRNAGQGGYGNDFAVDHITFNEVTRQNFKMTSSGSVVPVEIIKVIDRDGGINSLRVFSPDGETEYISPYDGLILSTGDCVVLGDGGVEQVYESQIVETYQVATGVGAIPGGLQSYSVTNTGGGTGLLNNQIIRPGTQVTFSAYFDRASNTYNRLSGMDYDATGTEFVITRIP